MAAELKPRTVRSVYLLTYSQADLEVFPHRASFADAVLEAFGSSTNVGIHQWVCCMEKHQDGGTHYHMAIKLNRCQRWLPVRCYMEESFGINVNFSNRHVNYFSAWRYVTKEDENPLESPNHPDLTNANPPRTMAASQAVSSQSQPSQSSQSQVDEAPSGSRRKRKRLSNFDFAEIVRTKKIKNRLELLALANSQREAGKTDLAEFIFNKSSKSIEEIMSNVQAMESAEADLVRARLARIVILERALDGECVDNCQGLWLTQAQQLLHQNNIPNESFTAAIRALLEHGRGKYRNIMIIGPANCGKSFLLGPLSSIFKCFSNPAASTFAWIGVEEAEVIILNDFRWSKQVNVMLHLFLLRVGGWGLNEAL